MEHGGFQSQLLSVLEVLSQAAVAEMDRRVEDGCAVLRLEVSRSRRDIELLKRRSEGMEAELRRTRARARRKVCYPPAADRFSPGVKVVLNRERQHTDWEAEVQSPNQQSLVLQCEDVEPADKPILIKDESAEEDNLISEVEQPPFLHASEHPHVDSFAERYHSSETPADPGLLVSVIDGYDAFPEQQLSTRQTEVELVVKQEEQQADENEAALESAHIFEAEEGDGQLWSTNLCRDDVGPSFSYAEHHFETNPSVFPSALEDMGPQMHPVGKSHPVTVNAARVKRRARTFGCKRAQQDEGHLSHNNTVDQSLIPQHSQHQLRDSAQSEDVTPPSTTSSFRSNFGLARRIRTPWRTGIGEKRYSCTFCNKIFMRFSQLKEHLRSHTGEKPFSCVQCGRSFTKQCNLIRHAVVHSGEKPFHCALCGKSFTQRSSLKSHQKTAH
ncbi:zinc finger protein 250 [Pseudochaenichthys georgianus]|uniref:zinc finger protein 250 n=1 Tax=Pseudochaenichthys georgianus TaxID=52239 RepID=UPI00146C3066|nr:zinc finger protein 398 [Pseudochaenichthys georgianus]XP_033959686.1 zinc finger protein 398 [Pseudochaenichthys georgianus]